MAMVRPAGAAGSCAIFRSWNTGDQLTAPDLTTSFVTVGQTNMIPTCMDGDSVNVAAMQTVQDPFPARVESLAINLKGELERLRFVVKQGFGWPNWYDHPGNALTTSASFYSQTGTWNNGAVTFPGAYKLNITDTASAAGSLLMDLQVGGVSKFKVDKAGVLTVTSCVGCGGGSGTFTDINVTNNTNMVKLGTTNIGTMTLAGGALTGARTWTWPDITGIVALTNGGQTFTSAIWNGSIIGTTYGGTGLDTHLAANGTLLIGNSSGFTLANLTSTGATLVITNTAGGINIDTAPGGGFSIGMLYSLPQALPFR
jgi:hypothetical protein